MQYLDDPEKVPSINDVELLKVGRHFRLSKAAKLIVVGIRTRNYIMSSLVINDDIVIEAEEFPWANLHSAKQQLRGLVGGKSFTNSFALFRFSLWT